MPTPRERRIRRLATEFDESIDREWRRYQGEPTRRLLRVVRERFLRLHLRGCAGIALELGPGPGRFSPIIRETAKISRAIGVDISRGGLVKARQRARVDRRAGKARWVQAAGESLPLRPASVDVAVVLGNIFGMAGQDAGAVLEELGRVVRPGGRLIAEFASPAGAVQEFLTTAARRRFLPRLLRRPDHYLIDEVLATGLQPYAPARLARWEFQFFTPQKAKEALETAGFEPRDTLAVAPFGAFQPEIARIASREPLTWENLVRLEEATGRRPGVLEAGHGIVVSADRH